jgi:carbon monoxide dehydrogenase subunit G
MSRSPKRTAELCPKAKKLLGKSLVQAGARVTIETGRDPIWALLSDPNGWSTWYGGVKDSKGAVPLRIGGKLSFKAGPTTFRGRVDELVELRTLRFSGKSPGSSATYLFRIETHGEHTQVSASVNMGGVAIFAAKSIMQSIAERAVLRWLDALAEAVSGVSTT